MYEKPKSKIIEADICVLWARMLDKDSSTKKIEISENIVMIKNPKKSCFFLCPNNNIKKTKTKPTIVRDVKILTMLWGTMMIDSFSIR